MMDVDDWPHGWPKPRGYPLAQGPYYCAVGAGKVFGRHILEAHYRYDAEQEKGLTRFSGESKNLPSRWSKPLISHHQLWHAGYFFKRINAKCLLV